MYDKQENLIDNTQINEMNKLTNTDIDFIHYLILANFNCNGFFK
jgi:hypothetical protein